MFESQPLNDSPSPSSLMASFSSSSSRTWKYDVFASLHGLDVPKTYVHHICKQLNYNGITMFDDQGIERGQTTSPALTEAIRESRISIVVLSKNYASSSLCLDELLEILKCKENFGQIVMLVFYRVDPSHVRKQTGDFGIAFNETCARKTQEERRRWSQALNYVSNIAGEHSLNWDNESEMIEKIFQDISYKLNTTISRDFGNIVGLQTHMEMMRSLLHIDNEDQAMIVFDPSSSNNRIGKGKHRCSTGMAFLVVINLLVEIASAVAEQLSSIRKPYFARISLVMSTLSVVFSILDLTYKIRAHKARFKCKWPIPWFYYPSRGYNRIFGNFTDTVLLFCVVGGLIVATVNWSYIDKRRDGPIKVSIWPLLFAIGMVASKFMEKPAISRDNLLYLE